MPHNTTNSDNDVNGDSSGITSSGREHHVLRVIPDRHPATVEKVNGRKILNIGTWNVRTLVQNGKLENIKMEMKRMNINILGISEMRWPGAGEKYSDQHRIIYSGGKEYSKGVGIILDPKNSKTVKGFWTISDRVLLVKLHGRPFDINLVQIYAPTADSSEEDIDAFYDELDMAVDQCKNCEVTMVLGDFNAKVGSEKVYGITGGFGLGEKNERGDRLIAWAESHSMIIGNTWFKHHPRRLWTWKSPGDNVRNQIDYILLSRRFQSSLVGAKTRPGADCFSDHVPVIGKIRIKLKNIKRSPQNIKLNLGILRTDKEIREQYNVTVQNRYNAMEIIQTIDEQWDMLRESIQQTSKEIIPPIHRVAKKKWMSTEILQLMDERRKKKNNKEEYSRIVNTT